MSPTGACGRADLVRALARGDPALADALAGLLGFEVAAEPTPVTDAVPMTTQVGVALDAILVRPPEYQIDVRPLIDIPFWRLEGHEPVASEEPGPKPPPPAEPVVWRNRPDAPPAIRLLAPWRELQPRLRAALAEPREGREIDVNLIVRRLSCGQWLDRLPHERHRRWGPCLQLVIDRSEHLVPYWTDQDQVRGELARLFAAQDLEQAAFHEGLDEPRLLGASASDGYRPPPGGIVLVLGDLGGLTARAADEDNPWLDLGRRITAAGSRPVALLPCPLERCPAVLRRDWQLVPWERSCGHAITDHHALRERAERLLRLVSPAVRIEPGLLRMVRLSLGADEADAGTESDVWQHPAIASTHSEAATLDPKYTKELRAAFAAEPLERQWRMLALLRVWRGHLPQEIWFEEIRDLARASLEALPDAADLEDARRFFDSICDRLEPTPDGPADTAVGAWMGRVRGRATDDFWTIDEVGARLLRLDWLRNRHRPDYRLPVPCDPALLPAPPGQAEHRYELRQEGDGLVVVPAPPTAAISATDPGSYLGTLRTVNQLVQILRTAPASADHDPSFWRSGQPPPWADDWGTDDYGHWVTFSVENRQGQKITQRMRWIEPGTFLMGSPENEPERFDDEGPRHPVTIPQGYWLFDTACTQALWAAVTGENRSGFKGADRPVETVSWHDCQDFIKRLNERLPGLDLALPSEAQWEYACRAGTTTPFSFGANITPDQVNYNGNSPYAGGKKGWYRQQTVPVASLPPNPWGLHEMHGNVREWCQDHWHGSYRGAPDDDSAWLSGDAGADRVLRGGSWYDLARIVRAASRYRAHPDGRGDVIGFRCARVRVASPGSQEGAEPAGPARGRQAERRPEQGQPGRATGVQPTLLRLNAGESPVRCALSQAPAFLIRTDREHLTFRSLTKPEWASAIGRDRFGLWCEIAVEPERGGEPVIQRLRWIPPGRFWMGSPEEETRGLAKNDNEQKWFDAEHPRHLVTLTEGYWLFDTPCTQALWEAVMEKNPSRFQSPTRPVEQVRWHDAQDFLKRLNGRIPDLDLALPSEAQWEYACRAGTETAIYTGDLAILGANNAPALDPIAWYGGNSGVDFDLKNGEGSSSWPEKQYPHTKAGTHPVKLKRANPWGLYDMLGNVWEWCQDGMRDYGQNAQTNPTGSLEAGANRVLRGGSWHSYARGVRAAYRCHDHPGSRGGNFGFRCARVRVASPASRPVGKSDAPGAGAAPSGAPGRQGGGSRSEGGKTLRERGRDFWRKITGS
ncbi:MAG: formylglycine-generating enzyme family protein [Candidatus Competibacter sp.]|nr:formylglycine-generating enzyme family protein [Candidatus Competibacter sp.]